MSSTGGLLLGSNPDAPFAELVDFPPTCDMSDADVEGFLVDYPDFDPASTFVVSGPLHADYRFPGTVRTKQEAREWAKATHGDRVVRELNLPFRWAFRVRKP
jgi:hypothetical protein